MTDKIATVPWSIPGVLSGGPGGAWGSGKSAQRKTGRPVSRSAKDTILRMSKTLEKWLPEELSRFHPCAVAEFDAFALWLLAFGQVRIDHTSRRGRHHGFPRYEVSPAGPAAELGPSVQIHYTR